MSDENRSTRRRVVREGLAIGLATGAYGVSFGALAAAAGLSVVQAVALSALMFTGASQFAFVGVVATGGAPLAAASTAVLLGTRNGLYGLDLSRVLGPARRWLAAHVLIDESAALALAQDDPRHARTGFWAAGLAVFFFWNLATLVGALGAGVLGDPASLGLDAVAPAAFLALLAPRLVAGETWAVAAAAAAVAVVSTPFVPVGVPVLLAVVPALLVALRPGRTGAA